ncbi:uncharacterized protein B0H18DRAFT_1113679 [Fomitopsis serialis]|uniref:uncharacterized protein n=1 Tax=Fomitopsis serialis TaxID=139415 RepID=UPI002008A24A|nr:uncharacterized protein B0H18DRAFT_1113679 [Neoantrodia serialis]KAH9936262.1 hypothetical protein B0H18DRAFT_1113679 [Neoantrodia serialis]
MPTKWRSGTPEIHRRRGASDYTDGYGVEFGSDAMVHKVLLKRRPPAATNEAKSDHRQPHRGQSLLAILREAYDSKPWSPSHPTTPTRPSRAHHEALETPGRVEEIKRLAALWQVDVARGQEALDEKSRSSSGRRPLLAGTGKRGRPPRLDFFLMHMLK